MQNTSWLDRSLYPFTPRYLELEDGRMHYVDEGSGSPVLMVHGTPTWSFLYRDLIKALSTEHRVIAPDHLGFGLSEKPENGAYRPEDHARRYTRLNFSPKVLMKAAYGDKAKLTPEVHQHYIAPFSTAKDRRAPWILAKELIDSSGWYEGLWQRGAFRTRGGCRGHGSPDPGVPDYGGCAQVGPSQRPVASRGS
jgi:hypothetical protein